MAINKVVFGDETLLDLTEDTVTPDSVYEGYTFHSADGTLQVGSRSAEGVVRYDVEQLLTDIQKAQARANIGASEAEHASTHASGGSDPITPGSIGAAAENHTHDYAASDHTHTPAQIGAATAAHGHAIADVTSLQTALDGKQPVGSVAEHASTHAAGGSDPIDPFSIGAARDCDVTTLANEVFTAINNHTHTPSSIGAASSDHTHTPSSLGAAAASVAVTALLYADNWERNLQAVSASGVTESNNIIVSPHPDYYSEYTAANIRAVSQSNGSVEFECDTVPSGLVEVNILIVG